MNVGKISGPNITTQGNTNSAILIRGEIFTWWPLSTNTSNVPEAGDPAEGRIENYLYQLKYIAGDPNLLASWDILNQERLY